MNLGLWWKSSTGTANEAPVFYVNPSTGNSKIIGEASPDFMVGFPTHLLSVLLPYMVCSTGNRGEKFNETAQYLTYVYRSEFSDLSSLAANH